MAKFKTISLDHACIALTQYLHALSMLNDNQIVTGITKSPGSVDLKLEVKED